MSFLKKKNKDNGPPDVGKEELEYKENVNEYREDSEEVPDSPIRARGISRDNFRDSEARRKFQSLSQPGPGAPTSTGIPRMPAVSGMSSSKMDFEMQKIGARLEVINSLITAFNERFARINQEIGEIRTMAIANEKNLSLSNLDAKRAVDIVKEVSPERLRVEYQKTDLKISTITEKMESYKQYMDSIMNELKELKRRANLFEGTDALLKLDEDVKKDLIEIQKVNSRVKMNADKSEQIFIELSKGFNENRKLNETIMALDNSYSGLKKEVERLSIDYKQILDVDDFSTFKKEIKAKTMMLENSFAEIEKIREENDKLAKGIGRLLLMEKKNEEDIVDLAMRKGNTNISGVTNYEEKLFSILEIIEKMTGEMGKIKERLGIKSDVSEQPNLKTENQIREVVETSAGSQTARNENERLRIENEGKIGNLITQGKSYLANGDINNAWKTYENIFSIYNPAEDINRAVYYKIINFYDTLADTANKPVVAVQPALLTREQLNPADFPAQAGERKFKKLSDY